MKRLEIRLFGSFEVRHGGELVDRFESQRVRALLAYLVTHGGERSFSREHLSDLLWPHEEESRGRRNLRQALYNLRSSLAHQCATENPPVTTEGQSVRFVPSEETWVDLQAFHSALEEARIAPDGGRQHLARAIHLYRGDFLDDFFLPDSPVFEDWRRMEQERLREATLDTLRVFVNDSLRTGDHNLGIQYAQRLLRLDPTSEEAHRQLMLLYSLSGRRDRALGTYENLTQVLAAELDVEPMEETTHLYQQILVDELPTITLGDRRDPVTPPIPLVGRQDAVRQLSEDWQAILRGRGRTTLVSGDEGIGKTRLVRTFLAEVAARREVVVLLGRGQGRSDAVPYQPLFDALDTALTTDLDLVRHLATLPPSPSLEILATVLPHMGEILPDLAGSGPRLLPPVEEIVRPVAYLIDLISAPGPDRLPRPVVLFIDDLDEADASTSSLLLALGAELEFQPAWLIGTTRSGALRERTPPPGETEGGGTAPASRPAAPGRTMRITLERLTGEDLLTIGRSLLGMREGPRLARLLALRSGGLPLAAVEWIHLLHDLGHLQPEGESNWRLVAGDPILTTLTPATLDEVVAARVRHLPASARRLLTLAAIAGNRFTARLLQRAEEEAEVVVEVCLEVMLQRWLIRHSIPHWVDSRRERDLTMWTQGSRQGAFEFSHPAVRRVILERLSGDRARYLHGRVASFLEGEGPVASSGLAATLAHHYQLASNWDEALEWLERAAAEATKLSPTMGLLRYERALALLDHLELGVTSEQVEEWKPRRERLQAAAERLRRSEVRASPG